VWWLAVDLAVLVAARPQPEMRQWAAALGVVDAATNGIDDCAYIRGRHKDERIRPWSTARRLVSTVAHAIVSVTRTH
jgi:hypothetical protein